MSKGPWDDAIRAAKKAAAKNAKKKIIRIHRGDPPLRPNEMDKLLDKWLREQKRKPRPNYYDAPKPRPKPKTKPKPNPLASDKYAIAEYRKRIREIEKRMLGEGGSGTTRVVRKPKPKKPSGSAAKRVPTGRK